MTCEHKRIRCTDNVFFCLDCGAKIDPPKTADEPKQTKKRGGKTK